MNIHLKIHVDLLKTGETEKYELSAFRITKKMRIGSVGTENGTAEVWVGIDLELSKNPRGSSENRENQKIRTFSIPNHRKLLKSNS